VTVPVEAGGACRGGVGDGHGEAEHAGDLTAGVGVVVVAEVAGHLVEGQPDEGEGGEEGVGEGLAGQDRAGRRVPGVVDEVATGCGDQQGAAVVLDSGFHGHGGDALGVGAVDEGVQ
jgi:hypothetical protein